MDNVKSFNDFTYKPIIENLENSNNDIILEKFNIGKYQRAVKKFFKEANIQLYFASTFGTALTVLLPVVEKLMKTGDFSIEPTIENVVLLTIFAFAVLTKESKDKVKKIYNKIKEKEIPDEDVDKVINQLSNTKELFADLLQSGGKVIESFADMLAYSGILIPFLSVITSLVSNGVIDGELLSQSFNSLKLSLGAIGFKLLLQRIMHKLDKIIRSDNKIKNKDNIKPFKVNDELKSPELKKDKIQVD